MTERIHKRLATLGVGSRREIERLIEMGEVSVNGEPASIGQMIDENDRVIVSGKRIDLTTSAPSKHLLIYNKPEGEICTRDDPQGRATVFDALPPVNNGRWISIGRLDVNTSGLLLFTTDGELANRLMHPAYKIDREYAVRVLGKVDEDMLAQLLDGVALEDGVAQFTDIVAPHFEEDNPRANQWFYVCLQEGRNREVRRLWESLPEIKVSRLKRVRYANIMLEKTQQLGQWRLATQEELDGLYQLVELAAPQLPTRQEDIGTRKAKHQRRARPASQSAAQKRRTARQSLQKTTASKTPMRRRRR